MNNTIESLRFLAIAGIVWLHVPESEVLTYWEVLGRFAVPFFAATSAFLAAVTAIRRSETSIVTILRSRSMRIYGMFLCWTAIYLAIRLLSKQIGLHSEAEIHWKSLLINGSAHHLWFLPFIAVGVGFAFAIGRLSALTNRFELIALVSLVAAIATEAGRFDSSIYAFRLAIDAMPSLMAGVSLALVAQSRGGDIMSDKRVGAVGAVVFIAAMVTLIIYGRNNPVENLAGVALLIFAHSFPRCLDWQPLVRLGEISFGVYVVHVLPLEAMQDMLRLKGVAPSIGTDVLVYVVAVSCSIAASMLGKNTPYLRWLFSLRASTANYSRDSRITN